MKLLYALGMTVLLTLTAAVSYAQSDETESGAAEDTAPPAEQGDPVIHVEQQPYEYYYWPDEDLDNFGLSTMGEDGGSTLGKTPRRKSNIEANPPKPIATPEPEEEPDEAINTGAVENPADAETGSEAAPSGAAFYKWVDEKGNLHITNNLGDVPLEYQQKMYQQKSGGEE